MVGKRKDKKKPKMERRTREGPESEPQTPLPQTSNRQITISQNKKRLNGMKAEIRSFLNPEISNVKSSLVGDRKLLPLKRKKRNRKNQKERGSHPLTTSGGQKGFVNYLLQPKLGKKRLKRRKMHTREISLSDDEPSNLFELKRHMGSADFDKSIEIQSKSSRKIKDYRNLAFQVNSMNHIPMGLEKESKLKKSMKQSGAYKANLNPPKQNYNHSIKKHLKRFKRLRGKKRYSQIREMNNNSLGLYEQNSFPNKVFQNTSGSINFLEPFMQKDAFKVASRKISKNHSLSGIEGKILNYRNKKLSGGRVKGVNKIKSRATYQPITKGSNRSIQNKMHKSIRLKKKKTEREKYLNPKFGNPNVRAIERLGEKLKYRKMQTIPQIYKDKNLHNSNNFQEEINIVDPEGDVELYSYNRPPKNITNPNMFLLDPTRGFIPKQNLYPQMPQNPEINYIPRNNKNIKIKEFQSMEFEDHIQSRYNPNHRPNQYAIRNFDYPKDFYGYNYDRQQYYKNFEDIMQRNRKSMMDELHNQKEMWEYQRKIVEIARSKYEIYSLEKPTRRYEILTMMKELRTLSMKIFKISNILFLDMNKHKESEQFLKKLMDPESTLMPQYNIQLPLSHRSPQYRNSLDDETHFFWPSHSQELTKSDLPFDNRNEIDPSEDGETANVSSNLGDSSLSYDHRENVNNSGTPSGRLSENLASGGNISYHSSSKSTLSKNILKEIDKMESVVSKKTRGNSGLDGIVSKQSKTETSIKMKKKPKPFCHVEIKKKKRKGGDRINTVSLSGHKFGKEVDNDKKIKMKGKNNYKLEKKRRVLKKEKLKVPQFKKKKSKINPGKTPKRKKSQKKFKNNTKKTTTHRFSRDEDDFRLDNKMTPKTAQFNVFKKSMIKKPNNKSGVQKNLQNFKGMLSREIQKLKTDKQQLNQAIKRDEEIIEKDSVSRIETPEANQEKEWIIKEIQRRMQTEGNFLGSIRDFLKGDIDGHHISHGVSLKNENDTGKSLSREIDTESLIKSPNIGRRTRKDLEYQLDHIKNEIQNEVRHQKDNILGPSDRNVNRKIRKHSLFDNLESGLSGRRDLDRDINKRKLTIEVDLPHNKETPNPKSSGHVLNARAAFKNHFGEIEGGNKMMSARGYQNREIPLDLGVYHQTYDNPISKPVKKNFLGNNLNKKEIENQKSEKDQHDIKYAKNNNDKDDILNHRSRNSRNIDIFSGPTNQNINFEKNQTDAEKTQWRSKAKKASPKTRQNTTSNKKKRFIDLKLDLGKSGLSEDHESDLIKKKTRQHSLSKFKPLDENELFDSKIVKTPKYKNGTGSLKKNIQQPARGTRQIIHLPNPVELEDKDELRQTDHKETPLANDIKNINILKSKDDKRSNSGSGSSGGHKTSGSESHFLIKRSSTETSNYSVLRPKHITSQKNMTGENELPDSSAHNHIFPSKQLSIEDDSHFYFSKKQIGDANGISLEQNMRITHETNDSALFFSKKRVSEANFDITNSEVQNEIKASREMNSIRNGSQAFLNFPKSQAGTLLSNLSAGIGSFPYGSNQAGVRSSQRNMLPPEFESDLMSTKEKKMTQLNHFVGLDSARNNMMSKRNRREIKMDWITKESDKKHSERIIEDLRKIESSERGIQKASNRFLFGDDDEGKNDAESIWSQAESGRKADVLEIHETSAVLPSSIQAAKDINSKKKRSILTIKNYNENTDQTINTKNQFRNAREIVLPKISSKDSKNSNTEEKSENEIITNSNSDSKPSKQREIILNNSSSKNKSISQKKSNHQKKESPSSIEIPKIKNINDKNYLDLKKRNFSKTEPDNKRRTPIHLEKSDQMKILTSHKPEENLLSPSQNPKQQSKASQPRENEKKLLKQIEEQKIRIQELGTKYKGIEELLNLTEKKKRELEKKNKIQEAKLQQKGRHAKKVETILKKFHTKLKQFPVPKMGFKNRKDLNFLEKQNLKFVQAAHRNQNLLKVQARKLKEAEDKAKKAEENAKELENETMDLRDRMNAHRSRAERVEREILEVRERNQKYSELIRKLEDKIMGLEHDLANKKKEFLKMKKRESKCANCSQRSIKNLTSKKSLIQIKEESHSSLEDENYVTIEEYNELKNDKNEWKGNYVELFHKFTKNSESLKKKDIRIRYLMDKISQLGKQIGKYESGARRSNRHNSRRDAFGSGRA